MPDFILKNPLTVQGGTGVTSSLQEMFGLTAEGVNEINIGQNVATSSNVSFNNTNIDETQTFILQNNSGTENLVLGYGFISGSTVLFDGSLVVSESHTHENDVTVLGAVSYKEGFFSGSSVTTIHQSGSTTLGDSLDDVHNITGSYLLSASEFTFNSYGITEISNDTALTDASSTALVTENVVSKSLAGVASVNPQYLRKCFAHTGSISNSTASFSATTASVSTLTSTTKNDFQFFLNGMLMEPDAITIEQSGSIFLSHINATTIGYNLGSSDEVVAWGKFNS